MDPYREQSKTRAKIHVIQIRWVQNPNHTQQLKEALEKAIADSWELIAFSDSGNSYTCIMRRDEKEP